MMSKVKSKCPFENHFDVLNNYTRNAQVDNHDMSLSQTPLKNKINANNWARDAIYRWLLSHGNGAQRFVIFSPRFTPRVWSSLQMILTRSRKLWLILHSEKFCIKQRLSLQLRCISLILHHEIFQTTALMITAFNVTTATSESAKLFLGKWDEKGMFYEIWNVNKKHENSSVKLTDIDKNAAAESAGDFSGNFATRLAT